MTNRVTGQVRDLAPGQIFVFGSNEGGRHGRGAAAQARRQYGAKPGQGAGLMGRSYGIPTKDAKLNVLGLGRIRRYVARFLEDAAAAPHLHFLVTEVGCGLSGYQPADIAPLFAGARALENVSLPASFWAVLGG